VTPSKDESPPQSWFGSTYPPMSPRQAITPKERSPWTIPIILWAIALAIALAFFLFFYVIGPIVFALALGNSFSQGLEEAQKEDQSAGMAANDAVAAVGPQFGSLSPPVLNTSLPNYQWVDGATAVFYSAKRPVVSMTTGATHIETAVQEMDGFCSFGLTITSSADLLTTEDHVAGLYPPPVGPGTYYQSAYGAPQCAADQAPASGWQTWPSALLGG
jgi:hypothetical protein